MQSAFRSFSSSIAQDFVKDILDGFFPWEFHESHPEGVHFSWSDYRRRRAPFSSKGYSLLDDAEVKADDALADVPELHETSPVQSGKTSSPPSRWLAKIAGPMVNVSSGCVDGEGERTQFPQSPMTTVQTAVKKVSSDLLVNPVVVGPSYPCLFVSDAWPRFTSGRNPESNCE